MNNNFYKQGVVWGGYPVKKDAPDYLVSRYIKVLINRFRSYQLSNKFIQSSFLSAAQEYQKNQSFDGLWQVHAKNIQGKITTKQSLVEACSFLRVFLEREKKVILTDKQFLAIWALNHQFFIHDYVGVNKKYAVFFAACIEYWKGHKVHLAMASDKLAVSEYEDMQDCYHSLGIEVAIVTSTMSFNERQKAYQAQIVYIGAQQLARDALIDLDNLKAQSTSAGFFLDKLGTESVHSKMLLSGLCSVIINDANLILLELAAQPVLLEQETVNNELYTVLMLAIATAKKLVANEDFIIDQSRAEYQLTKSGKEKIQGSTIKFNEFWRSEKRANSIIRDALIVLQEYKNEQHYTIQEQKIRILKESQYALNVELKSLEILIGIKEGLAEPAQRIVKSQISYQYFFSHYFRVMGFTYSGNEIKRELQQVYNFSSYTLNKEQKTSFELYCLQDKSEKLDKLRQLVEIPLKTMSGQVIILRSEVLLESVTEALQLSNREVEVVNAFNKEKDLEAYCNAMIEANKILILTGFVEYSSCLAFDLNKMDVYILEGYENSLVLRFWQMSGGRVAVISAMDDPIIKALMNDYILKLYRYLMKISFFTQKMNSLYLSEVRKQYDKFKRKQRQKVKQAEMQYRKFYAFSGAEKI